MSNFDKLVASWVSAADSRPREEREAILTNINRNFDTYRDLENPSEAHLRRQERKRREEEKKRLEEEEKKRAEEEERRRMAELRRASLPPLPPSASNRRKTGDAAGEKKTGNGTAKAAGTPRSGAGKSAEAAPQPALTQRERARMDAAKIEVRNFDYGFANDVSAALEKLRAGEDLRRSSAEEPEPEPPAPVPTTARPGKEKGREKEKEKRKRKVPRATVVAPAAAASSSAASPSAATDSGAEGALTEKPLTPIALDATMRPSPTAPPTGREKPPVLSMLQQDNEDAEEYRIDEGHERAAMEHFTFGAQDSGTDGDHSEDGHGCAGLGMNFAAPSSDRGGGDSDSDDDDDVIPDEEDALRRADQKKRPSRLGISDASINIDEARLAAFPPTPKSRDKVKIITRVLEKHYLFSFLDDDDIAKFASIMDLEDFAAGATVLTKGESNDTFFIILDGSAETTVPAPEPAEPMEEEESEEDEKKEETALLEAGATFGDIALMYDSGNAATVRAATALKCASLERKTYKLVTSRSMAERRERFTKFVADLPIFADLSPAETSQLAEALKAATFAFGDKLITRGTTVDWLHFIVEGAADVIGHDGQHITTVEKGGVVGHLEFLYHHVAVADVVAASPIVKTAKLSRHQFSRLVASAEVPMRRSVDEDVSFEHYRQMMKSGDAPARDDTPGFDEPPVYVSKTIRTAEAEQAARQDS